MITSRSLRTTISTTISAVGILGLAFATATPAHAADPRSDAARASSSSPVSATRLSGNSTDVVAKMTLDCTHMTASARSYAQSHGYCPVAPSASNGGHVTPADSTVYGACGSSWMHVTSGGPGIAKFSYGFQSSEGTVVYRQLDGGWDSSRGADKPLTDYGYMFSSRYDGVREANVGDDTAVHAWITGQVTMVWGGHCILDYPDDTSWIF